MKACVEEKRKAMRRQRKAAPTVTMTWRELWLLREFAAYAVRSGFKAEAFAGSAKTQGAVVARICENVLLRAALLEDES